MLIATIATIQIASSTSLIAQGYKQAVSALAKMSVCGSTCDMARQGPTEAAAAVLAATRRASLSTALRNQDLVEAIMLFRRSGYTETGIRLLHYMVHTSYAIEEYLSPITPVPRTPQLRLRSMGGCMFNLFQAVQVSPVAGTFAAIWIGTSPGDTLDEIQAVMTQGMFRANSRLAIAMSFLSCHIFARPSLDSHLVTHVATKVDPKRYAPGLTLLISSLNLFTLYEWRVSESYVAVVQFYSDKFGLCQDSAEEPDAGG